MKQSDAIEHLFKDLNTVTDSLVLEEYPRVFEEEMQEYFPFQPAIMDWLQELYASDKYLNLRTEKLCLYLEKDHPFLFVRDLAHLNSWNTGFYSTDRETHIAGLMFSGNETMALEATFCLCRPSRVNEEKSSWFDFKQAMANLEKPSCDDHKTKAWKACAYFYLYFYLTGEGQAAIRSELLDLVFPYEESIEWALHFGDKKLRAECAMVSRIFKQPKSMTTLDVLF